MRRVVFLALCAVQFVAWLAADLCERGARVGTAWGWWAGTRARRFR